MFSTSISIHAPRVGSDLVADFGGECAWNFNPRSPCGERLDGIVANLPALIISIHAPRVGSDGQKAAKYKESYISIHAPRVGSDAIPNFAKPGDKIFQSTLPVWGATPSTHPAGLSRVNFNPRSPCGERPHGAAYCRREGPISIHAPRVGSDRGASISQIMIKRFQSTLPVWGATNPARIYTAYDTFQSTLPVWGATATPLMDFCAASDFNPRSPCGERHL